MPTRDECKRMISKVGFKCGISPKLIATRLLSDEDKQAMIAGDLEAKELEAHVIVWNGNGQPDYAHGKTDRLIWDYYHATGKSEVV